jgi:Flp pilus assembly protein TadB
VILSPLESSVDSSLASSAATWTITGIGIGAFLVIIGVVALFVLRQRHAEPAESMTEMEEAVDGCVRESIDDIPTDHVLELASYENALEAPAGSHRLTQVDFWE